MRYKLARFIHIYRQTLSIDLQLDYFSRDSFSEFVYIYKAFGDRVTVFKEFIKMIHWKLEFFSFIPC